MSEHDEKLRRALAQLRDELDTFNAADREITVLDAEGYAPPVSQYDERDRLALEAARSASILLELLDDAPPVDEYDRSRPKEDARNA